VGLLRVLLSEGEMNVVVGKYSFERGEGPAISFAFEGKRLGFFAPCLLVDGQNVLEACEVAVEKMDGGVGFVFVSGGLVVRVCLIGYANNQNALIAQWQLENHSAAPVELDKIDFLALHLDRHHHRLWWSLQGAAVHWGQDFAFELPEQFNRENFLGHLQDGEGGGVPLNDFWNPDFGVALACLEKVPSEFYMPVQTSANVIATSIQKRGKIRVEANEFLKGPQMLLMAHKSDFFEPLSVYRQLLQDQGVMAAAIVPEDYEPAWCSWGYEFDVRPEEILGVIPMLTRLGLRWVTLDDRWFDHYGDWNPREDTFPGGEAQTRHLTDQIHKAGLLAQLWWYPLCAEDGVGEWDGFSYGYANILEANPHWVVLNQDGSVARNNRHLAMLCPALAEVQDYTLALAQRFIADWGFDGFKLDNIYTMPACYNPAHHHSYPQESIEQFGVLYQRIFTQTRQLRSCATIQICSCGTPLTFSLLPATSQPVTADPTSSAQIRQRIKFYKALFGTRAAVFADHVELSDSSSDFASEIGPGGVPGTKFIWPNNPEVTQRLREVWLLTPEKERIWEKWFGIYNRHRPAEGEYLGLYDIAFDYPEGHVIRKGDCYYYAFFADHFQGTIELRGLESRKYHLIDYVNDLDWGFIDGAKPHITAEFKGSLLLMAIPS